MKPSPDPEFSFGSDEDVPLTERIGFASRPAHSVGAQTSNDTFPEWYLREIPETGDSFTFYRRNGETRTVGAEGIRFPWTDRSRQQISRKLSAVHEQPTHQALDWRHAEYSIEAWGEYSEAEGYVTRLFLPAMTWVSLPDEDALKFWPDLVPQPEGEPQDDGTLFPGQEMQERNGLVSGLFLQAVFGPESQLLEGRDGSIEVVCPGVGGAVLTREVVEAIRAL